MKLVQCVLRPQACDGRFFAIKSCSPVAESRDDQEDGRERLLLTPATDCKGRDEATGKEEERGEQFIISL